MTRSHGGPLTEAKFWPSRAERELAGRLWSPTWHRRPKTRAECRGGPRPCPWVGCRWHLYLDVKRCGSIVFNFPLLEPSDLVASCSLDVIETGGHMLQEVADLLNVTRERLRQIQDAALEKIRKRMERLR